MTDCDRANAGRRNGCPRGAAAVWRRPHEVAVGREVVAHDDGGRCSGEQGVDEGNPEHRRGLAEVLARAPQRGDHRRTRRTRSCRLLSPTAPIFRYNLRVLNNAGDAELLTPFPDDGADFSLQSPSSEQCRRFNEIFRKGTRTRRAYNYVGPSEPEARTVTN